MDKYITFNVGMDHDNYKMAVNLYNKGNSLLNNNKTDEAIECFEQAISIRPTYCNGWIGKGSASMILHDLTEALICFDEVLKIDLKNPFAWYNKGIILISMGKRKEGINALKKMIQYAGPEYSSKVSEVKALIDRL